MDLLVNIYRNLPLFKGKLILGKKLFSQYIGDSKEVNFKSHFGIKYTIPNMIENIGIELFLNGIYEKETIDFLMNNMKNDETFFDIGANIGAIGLPILFKKNIKYHAFEASPSTFNYLFKNFEINNINVSNLNNNLVHSCDNVIHKFYISELHGKNSLSPIFTENYITINSVSIDNYCEQNQIDTIDYLKIDVEGHEYHVLEGAKSMIKKKKIKNIIFESVDWLEDAAGISRGKSMNFLLNYGYKLYTLNGDSWQDNFLNKESMILAKF